MPLEEQMYCSQQICIPPSYPYILRQFAKAAIRTQPNDLLTWATSYFRCLALNIPPPVKPRLEYPIPRDYFGITPGWLRTLHIQLLNPETVSFKVLWDRWMGACLPHPTLVQILCLGAFDNNTAIPWLRFLGLCAGHLTDNLTQTMVMVCEILTEEPDGGSAMIPGDVFLDIYKFLAAIEASKPQMLKNIYFTDDILELYKKEKEKIAKESSKELTEESRTASYAGSIEEKKEEDSISIISCPSVAKDEYFPIDEYLKILEKKQAAGEDMEEGMPLVQMTIAEEEIEMHDLDEAPEKKSAEDQVEELPEDTPKKEETEELEKTAEQEEQKDQIPDTEQLEDILINEDLDREEPDEHEEELPGEDGEPAAVEEESIQLLPKSSTTSSGQLEETPKADEEAEVPLAVTPSQQTPTGSQVAVYKEPDDEEQVGSVKEEEQYEEVYVDAIPGIGPVVPEGLVEKVCEYFEELAQSQYGMLMPRNVRHYTCPPLEVFD